MKRTRIILGLMTVLLVALAITAAQIAEAQPALQADDENCVTCHTDKETLQALAVEPEEEEELSEGEG